MPEEARPPAIFGPLNIYGILALTGIIGPAVLIMANLIASFSEPSYSLIRDSISSLVWTPLGWLQSIGFLIVGLLVEVFSTGLLFSIRAAPGFRIGIGLLAGFGFGLLLLGAFPTDPVGVSSTIQGTIHTVASALVFIVFPIASLLIAVSLRRDQYWKGLFGHTIFSSALAAALIIGRIWLGELSWFGLYERILVANTVIWVEIMAIKLLRLSLSHEKILKRPRIF
jgi:hypothetical protein